MVAVADLHHHRDFHLLSARHRFKRRKRRGLHDVLGRRNLRRQQVWEQQSSCRQQHADREPQIHVRFEFHTVTSLPICCEITRLITSKRFSPVFSSTNELFVSDQPSLKLVESAEIQISRTDVFVEITNLLASGSSKITSSLPLSPSTSKPFTSPASSSRFFNSSNAASHFFSNSLPSTPATNSQH